MPTPPEPATPAGRAPGPIDWNSPVDRLCLERDLHRTLIRYAHLCDRRDWAAMDDVFAPDATADYGGWPLADPARILRMLQRHLGGCGPTQHLLGNLLCDEGSDGLPSTCIAIRACHQGAGPRSADRYECIGEYHDEWRWVEGRGWRIARRRMVVHFEIGDRGILEPNR